MWPTSRTTRWCVIREQCDPGMHSIWLAAIAAVRLSSQCSLVTRLGSIKVKTAWRMANQVEWSDDRACRPGPSFCLHF